ncbi:MAG: flavin reductase family protein [Clostridia bacterium]|nr:flavin reductase family protein [Clostridia bacterium]
MKEFTRISVSELDPVFDKIGKEWMLISAADGESANTMTASWGGMGVLWNLPVATCYIRPQRYTCPLVEAGERISLAFLGEEHRAALTYCGRHSGREGNKFEAAGLRCAWEDGVPYPEEAHTVLICRKLYAGTLRKEEFIDDTLLGHYPTEDFHRVFTCHIEKVLVRK